ncbi:MAG: type II/IV secretion system protein [Candidatus Pacebacteria bacterium]|nr:type II/IV secretion system protein [Candidatus Paceibacterota bacterium]
MIQFKEAKHIQRLKKLRQQSEETMVEVYANKYGIKYIDLSLIPINTDALRIIPEDRARLAKMAVFDMIGRKLSVAVASPLPDLVQEETVRLKDKKYKVELFMVSKKSLEKSWSRYGDISYAVKTEKGVIDISSADMGDLLKQIETLNDAKNIITEAIHSVKAYRISKIIELILYSAYALEASDVHIETSKKNTRVRFRLDGILTTVVTFDLETYHRILSRIKLTAGLKINIRNNAQDGRFTIKMMEKDLEIRTSTLPDAYGESIVMRILDPSSIAVPLEDLGMSKYFLEILLNSIKKPNGMIINTGPTGSGKSTTLFALLKKILSPTIKIVTIEDPIEYHIKGITQTQINKEKGYTFLTGLRAALRQDPDVLMVGEIRDSETASVAVNSALTGHLVFSTLHTNSAAGAFPRFLDLGIDPKILSTAIEIVIAQRLVRKLCPHCKKVVDFTMKKNQKKEDKIKKIFGSIENKEKYIDKNQKYDIYEAVGCDKCNGVGFKGRVAVVEAILVDKQLEELLKTKPTEREIVANTRHQGILTLKQDGILKIIKGETSYGEISRVIEL